MGFDLVRTVRLFRDGHCTVVEIYDDGTGFDPALALDNPEDGHFGLRILTDLAVNAGADLLVATAPGGWLPVATGGTGPVTTILLVDDHHLVRAGLAGLLDSADDLQVVGQAADGQQAIELAANLFPDVVLMDLSMPVLDGVEATRRVLAAYPAAKIVVLTSFSDQPRVADALAAGAVGYLLKDCEPRDLMAAVRSAAQGHAPLDPQVARALLPSGQAARPADELSAREQQVLRLVAKGLANKQIARTLGISESTVQAHISNVFRRIGVADRTSAAIWARDHLPDRPTTR